MAIHIIDGASIDTWKKFHDFFSKEFDFPGYYGRNMNAWVDCMSDPMEADIITLQINNVTHLKNTCSEIYQALIECTAFINWRYTDKGSPPLIALAFHQ